MHLRPITDSKTDYVALHELYFHWKNKSFSYDAFVTYVRENIVLVAEQENIIVGTCKIILEPKLIYNKYVCHVEDVVVHYKYRKQGVGTFMIQQLIIWCKNNQWNRNVDVYKLRLGCKIELEPFYSKCGLNYTGYDMVCYFHDSLPANTSNAQAI